MARRRASKSPPALRLTLDSGAVIALARRDRRARAVLTAAWEAGVDVAVPAVVVAETVRGSGPRDTTVDRVINAAGEVTPTEERAGRTAGALLGGASSSATVDALVVADSLCRGGGVILTADPDDLRLLTQSADDVVVEPL